MINSIHSRRRYAVIGVFIGTILVAALVYLAAAHQPFLNSPPLKPVSISTIVYPGSVPLYVAIQQEYFKEQGLDVELVPFSAGKDGLKAVLEGKVDYCIVAELPIVLAALDGKPLAIVGTIFSAERDHRLVARKDRGIQTPADLRGKTVGVTLGTTGDFILELVLNAGNLSRKDITIVDRDAEDLPAEILHGNLDAVSTWQPFLNTILDELGPDRVIFDGFDLQGIFTVNVNLVTTQNQVKHDSETTGKVLRAIMQAQEYIRKNPEEAQKIAMRSSGLDKASLEDLWKGYRFEVRLDQSLLISLEDTARWVIRNQHSQATEVPNFSNYIFPETLGELDPAAVRLIR